MLRVEKSGNSEVDDGAEESDDAKEGIERVGEPEDPVPRTS
jgi:hypothetical protein